ncbi:hypothetical protein KY495_16940 [Massilia sp. PAMC28688]|uniref:hypothetical protein n=1 Tax=Massilia sp. PAMC28688 TaxID=2861283 RepID=UPI001C6251E3|nr:hypothetical protein [Massilia sp. PAMC28688]QYF92426.1 hypothetical protein KY495_16940 [Massilia sp. PAMC28688]
MKNMRCEIKVSFSDRRSRKDMAGKVAVGLISLASLGPEVATWYLLSHGVPLDTIVRVMTMPHRRRR